MRVQKIDPTCVLIVLLLVGCSHTDDRRSAANELDSRPVVGHFRTQDQMITIYSAADGPRFVVSTTDGRVLDSDLDLRQLEERHSDIHRMYQSSIGAREEPRLDASVNGSDNQPAVDR